MQTHPIIDFVAQSPTSFHAASTLAAQLEDAGFQEQKETETWVNSAGKYYLQRNGALVAWIVPQTTPENMGFRIVGAHTDSPALKLKPQPDIYQHGFHLLGVEIYGGPIISSWFDRELVLAGRVIDEDGVQHLVHTAPVARIPHLAIHLDREANSKFSPDKQTHLRPVVALEGPEQGVLEYIANELGLEGKKILSHDLFCVPAQRAEVFGADGDLLASSRLDNLSSVYCGLQALLSMNQAQGNDVLVFSAFDHEEIGSHTPEGAAGPLLEHVLNRIALAQGASAEQLYQIYARSSCISADAAHSIHPNYPDKHDPHFPPVLGKGPVLKLNANHRYASDARSSALWAQACRAAGVSFQSFASNNNVACGSTIGPITATRLGISTVDVGVPLLSMHSTRELASCHDLNQLQAALSAYFEG